MADTLRLTPISTQLRQIAEQAANYPGQVFTTLAHRMDVNFLREAYTRLRKGSAPGLSGVTVKEYGQNLEANLQDLHERLKSQRYEAPAIKRVWIDKDGGKKRPIGLSEVEDKIVQKAVSMLISAVYDQDFYPCSYGFIAGRNAHQALREIRRCCMTGNIRWIVDADVCGFFDNIDRGKLREILKTRINDGGLLRLIGKWLNAGVMDGDVLSYSDKGTPQGGIISPVLANIFLHHVLDDWFFREVRPRLRGNSFLVRYADDFVIGCELEEDAKRVMEVLEKRFGKYGLELHPEKTRLISFGKPASDSKAGRGDNTFDFLGFTHYWARSRRGNWVIKRRTARKKVRKTVQSLWDWCKRNRHVDLEKQRKTLCSKLRGHFQYFGVPCNTRQMEVILHYAKRIWRHWLNHRSSRKALDWRKFDALLERMPLPKPRIIHNV